MSFNKLPLENLIDFCLRMAEKKKTDKSITWQGIADSLPANFNVVKSEAWVRKIVKDNQDKSQHFSSNEETEITNEDASASCENYNNTLSKLDAKILEMKKERVKLQDERTQNNAYIRRLSREETIIGIANSLIDKMSIKRLLPNGKNYTIVDKTKDKKEAILCLSDWHYGICCNNYWNEFNPEIARERINLLLKETIQYIKLNNVNKIHILNLGDLIAGRIHLTLRLESRFDVITQTLEISEILAEFLAELSQYVEVVEYYSCSDNHSRLEPNKSDSLDLESLCRVTDWYLPVRLQKEGINNIFINENIYGDDIITLNIMGYNVLGLHGDKDKNNASTIDSISRMTEDHYDLICTAHLHHFSADEKNRTVIIGNGSLMGVDSYAKNLRLSSFPSQNLIIVSEKSPCEAIYRIKLN